jgi:hypothetical protein
MGELGGGEVGDERDLRPGFLSRWARGGETSRKEETRQHLLLTPQPLSHHTRLPIVVLRERGTTFTQSSKSQFSPTTQPGMVMSESLVLSWLMGSRKAQGE